MNYKTATAEQILGINISDPEKLFSPNTIEAQFTFLRIKWHPDKCTHPEADDVFARIGNLKDEADERIKTGTWKGRADIQFITSKDGKNWRFTYLKMHKFELGKMYIGNGVVMYVLDEANIDLFDAGIKAITGIKYPRKELKDEFPKLLPRIKLADRKSSIGPVLVIEKKQSEILLSDLIDFVPDIIDPKQTGWITSALYNITTFLDFVGICHNSITPMTVFIDVDKHAVFLYGGWWYATKANGQLKAIPAALVKVFPPKVFKSKKAKTIYDRKAVKVVGLACLGDTSAGSSLLRRTDIPRPIVNWLRAPSSPDALAEYDGWMKVLKKCFGKRVFVKFPHDVSGIYRQEKR